jgi:hypothetical protein
MKMVGGAIHIRVKNDTICRSFIGNVVNFLIVLYFFVFSIVTIFDLLLVLFCYLFYVQYSTFFYICVKYDVPYGKIEYHCFYQHL